MARTRRNFSITWGMDDDEARAIDEKLDYLQNGYFKGQKTRNEMILYFFRFGLNIHWARLKSGKGPTDEEKLQIEGLPELSIVYDMIDVQKRKQQVVDSLVELYEDLGLDAFSKACDEYGIDWEGVLLDKFQFHTAPQSWSEQVHRELDVFLKDGLPHSVKDIRTWAEEQEFVTSDSEWGKLKMLASRSGYSGAAAHGYWRRTK